MTRLLSYLLIITAMSCSTAKPSVSQGTADIEVAAEQIYVDKFENIYAVTKDNKIIQYNSKGELLFKYANNQTGKITYLDVANPQKILAYIRDFGLILVLDNTLAEVKQINLLSLEYPDVQAIALSNDGNYWLYDVLNWRLLKIRNDGAILYESNRLSDFNLDPFYPVYMVERENKVLISTDTDQLLVFDNFAQYIKALPLPGISTFTLDGDLIYYYSDKQLRYYNMLLFTEGTVPISPSEKKYLQVVKYPRGILTLGPAGINVHR